MNVEVKQTRSNNRMSRKTVVMAATDPLIQQTLRQNITRMVKETIMGQVREEMKKGITTLLSTAAPPDHKQRKLDEIVNCFSRVIRQGATGSASFG